MPNHRRSTYLAIALLLGGCNPELPFQKPLDDKAEVQARVDAALARRDYAGALATIDGADRYADEQDIVAATIILTACREQSPWCAPPHGAAEAVRRLIRVTASEGGRPRLEAAGHLARWYRDGAGPALPANPQTAACWQAASTGRHTPLACYDRPGY